MSDPIIIRSYSEILGAMIAKLLAETEGTDMFPGAVGLTTLEAAATSDFITEGKLLRILTNANIDKTKGEDLKQLAKDMGLKPPFVGASSSFVYVTITETAFSKISSTVYAGANNPIAGSSTVLVVDASGMSASGTVYLGRNTPTYEAATYVSKVDSGSGYWTLNLSSPLVKDHLVGEEVVLAQGGDRTISAKTTCRVPSAAGSPQVDFSIRNTQVLPDGEDTLGNVECICTTPGSVGQVGINRVVEFPSLPWSTAAVTNPSVSVGGQDAETDPQLRQRIKDNEALKSRGVDVAIKRALIGTTDPDENKTIVSAYVVPPTAPGGYTIVYIDDGQGLKPSFSGVGSETIYQSAAGTEDKFQVQQFPVVKAQLVSAATEPFDLSGGETIAFSVDNRIEQKTFATNAFASPGQALAQEIAQQINALFSTVEARSKDGLLFVSPVADNPEYIQSISVSSGTDANAEILFPSNKSYTMRLYLNDTLLSKNGLPAIITSLPKSQWAGLSSSMTLQLEVDSITGPSTTIADADFLQYSSSSTLVNASPADWVLVINAKFIGITASANTDNTFSITSNSGNASKAQLSVLGGTLATALFAADTSSTGLDSQYTFNRLTGAGSLTAKMPVGGTLLAGDANTEGFADSAASSTFNIPLINSHATEIVLVPDSEVTVLSLSQSGTLTFSSPATGIQKIVSSVSGYFSNILPNDYVHLFNLTRHALLRVWKVTTTTLTDDTIQLFDPNPQTGGPDTLNNLTNLISAFRTEGRPQLITLPSGATVSAAAIVTSINDQAQGAEATALSSGAIRIQTTRLSSDGALGLPVVAGSGRDVLEYDLKTYTSNDPQVAAVESEDLAGLPSLSITINTADLVDPYDTLTVVGTPFGVSAPYSISPYANRGILTYFGSAESSFRYPALRDSTSQLTLRELAPNPWVEIGKDVKMTTTGGVEFGEADNLVAQLDGNPTQKSFNIPMYVAATVASPGVPSTTQFDAQDGAGALVGQSTWLNYRFDDYRVWFQAKRDITAVANAGLRITSKKFGPNGQKIRFGYFYPRSVSQSATGTINLNTSNDTVDAQLALASGPSVAIGTANGQKVYIDVSGGGPYTYKVQFSDPVDLSGINTTNCVVYPQGSMFAAANQSPIKVTSISNLRDSGKTYSSSGATVTISSAPSFTIATNDLIQVGGITYRITGVTTQTSVAVSPTPSPAISAGTAGVVSRVSITGTRQTNGTTESQTLVNASDVLAYSIGGETASVVMADINASAELSSLVTASLTSGNTGAGLLNASTEDQLNNGSLYMTLQNGESYVSSTSATSPGISLKEAVDAAPEVGDPILLIPSTCQNIADHLSKKAITGLTIAGGVNIVDKGRRIQVATNTPGGSGQVYISGGKAVGNTSYVLRNTAQYVSSTRGIVETDTAVLNQVSPGQFLKFSQTSPSKKGWTATPPGNADTIQLAVASGIVTATLSQNWATLYSFSHATVTWLVRKLSRNRVRYQIYSGTATVPSLNTGDWVYVGDGSTSYAGTTPAAFGTSSGNQGWFQVHDTDQSTYFDVENENASEDLVTVSSAAFLFTYYNSVRPGDSLVLGAGVPVGAVNQGTFTVLSVVDVSNITFANADGSAVGAIALGASGVSGLSVLDQGYTTYRQVVAITPKPSDPTNRVLCLVSPGNDMGLLSESQDAKIALQNRLNFPTTPVNGTNGYAYWTGPKRTAQRVIDGYLAQATTYPGYKASGGFVEARESQFEYISLALTIQTVEGIALNTISDDLKSRIIGYVNNLGLGESVDMLAIYAILEEAPGVKTAVFVTPSSDTQSISVNSRARAQTTAALISLS